MQSTTEDLSPESLIADFQEITRYDWFVSQAYNRLHWAELTQEDLADVPEYWSIQHPVRMVCGRVAKSLHIPGIFTRMGAWRCTGCCRATGMPQGKGSPKNDNACRELLGLPQEVARA
jgi:hypothetical protein